MIVGSYQPLSKTNFRLRKIFLIENTKISLQKYINYTINIRDLPKSFNKKFST